MYVEDDELLQQVVEAWGEQQVWAFLLDFTLPENDPAARGLGLPGEP